MPQPQQYRPTRLPDGFTLASRTRKYEIVSVLGSGGYGITYKARNLKEFYSDWGQLIPVGAELAIKECYRERGVMTRLPNGYARLLNEQTGIRLRRMFINEALQLKKNQKGYAQAGDTVPLLHVGHTGEGAPNAQDYSGDAIYYLVMPFLSGGSLEHICTNNARQIKEWLVSLLNTLSRIHAAGVLHRDIKPGNIMLHKKTPVLIDFGIATPVEMGDTRGGYSPDFASPEQCLLEKPNVVRQSDVFCLGATFYYLLAGRKAATSGQRAGNVPYIPLSGNCEVQARLRGLSKDEIEHLCSSVDKAMRFRIEDRWASADEWRRYLEAGCGEGISWWEKLLRWVQSAPMFEVICVLVMVFLVLVILVTLGIMLISGN